MFKPSATLPAEIRLPAEYHALGADIKRGDPAFIVSRSVLWKASECNHKFLFPSEDEETEAMSFGDLVDCIVLTPAVFEERFALLPGTYPAKPTKSDPRSEKPWNLGADYCKELVASLKAEGRIPIKAAVHKNAVRAENSFRFAKDGWLNDFRAASRCQVQVCADWHDEDTGLVVPCKALIDFLPDPKSKFGNTIGDLKTTKSARYRAWVRSIFSDGYHYQAAFYLDVANAATGLNYRCFEHLIVENTFPFEATHRMLSDDFVRIGRNHYQSDLRHYCHSLKTGKFRGYDTAMSEPESWMVE